MKMKKRFLSILLSLVMVLGLMPGMSLTAYAAEATETIATATNETTTFSGSHYKIEGMKCYSDGIGIYTQTGGSGNKYTVTISSLKGETIKKIEGNIGYNRTNGNNKLSTTKGSISISGDRWSGTLTVDNVNAESVTISNQCH